MELWLDTSNSDDVISTNEFGLIYGITTNPSLLSKSGKDPETVINSLLESQDGPVAVQVLAEDSEGMIQSALNLHAFSGRIIVKIPATQEGLVAMKTLVEKQISVMATAVFTPTQALLAGFIGVDYIAPYVGRMCDANIDPFAALQSMLTIYQKNQFNTKILVTSLRSPDQAIKCAEMGIHAINFKGSLFQEFIANDPDTIRCVQGFAEDWKSREYQATLAANWPLRS